MAILEGLTSLPTLLLYLVLLCVGWSGYTVVYNLYLHPLGHIPGPKLAAASYLYQTYFSLVGGSQYYKQILKLHKRYGPVIRITPDEVHLSDPNDYEIINHIGTKYTKDPQLYGAFGIGYSSFSTIPNDLHRIRRGALNTLFSRKRVLELEDVVQIRAQKLAALVERKFSTGQAIDLHHGFRAVSVDVITDYGFNKSYNLLDEPDLGLKFFAMVQGIGPTMWIFQQWPWVQKFALSIPKPIASMMNEPLAQVISLQEHCRQQIIGVKKAMAAGEIKPSAIPTMFQHLLTPGITEGYVVPSVDELKDEAYSVLAAAADTTGNCMTVAAYHVVNNPDIYRKLSAELKANFPDPNAILDFVSLERLPYLTGVVKEGLRLSFGVIGRLPRIVPEGGAVFQGFRIPAGSIVSMSSWVLHQDEEYFPNALKFDPERWIDTREARRIDKAFVPFGKGTRGCVGMPLAYCEIYVTLGTLFRRFENMKSNPLTAEDLALDDYFSSYHPISAVKFHVTSARDTKGYLMTCGQKERAVNDATRHVACEKFS